MIKVPKSSYNWRTKSLLSFEIECKKRNHVVFNETQRFSWKVKSFDLSIRVNASCGNEDEVIFNQRQCFFVESEII
jgi:hypothetical protein